MKNFEIASGTSCPRNDSARRSRVLAITVSAATLIVLFLSCGTSHAEFYRYNIDDLARKARVRIQEIEKKIAEEKAVKEAQDILTELRSLYEKAESLFAERRYEEAVTVYRKIDNISRDPNVAKLLEEKK